MKRRSNVIRNIGNFFNKTCYALFYSIRRTLADFYLFSKASKVAQIQLSMQYKEMLALNRPLPRFEEVEFRIYSQFGEDGILLYIFSLIGTTNKKCVEICGGRAFDDNTTNLIINHGWNGTFIDGNEENIRKGQLFYSRCADTRVWPPVLLHAWVSVENINLLLRENGCVGEIDLLSLDMDGNDYWVWEAIDCVNPRVVVLEFNAALGPDLSLAVPYRPDFMTGFNDVSPLYRKVRRMINSVSSKKVADRIDYYFGASLTAFVKLGKKKGYRLVGCERFSYNAFFMRSDVGEELFPEISSSSCFYHPFVHYVSQVRKKEVIDKEWVDI